MGLVKYIKKIMNLAFYGEDILRQLMFPPHWLKANFNFQKMCGTPMHLYPWTWRSLLIIKYKHNKKTIKKYKMKKHQNFQIFSNHTLKIEI